MSIVMLPVALNLKLFKNGFNNLHYALTYITIISLKSCSVRHNFIHTRNNSNKFIHIHHDNLAQVNKGNKNRKVNELTIW